MIKKERNELWRKDHVKTIRELVIGGLWPADIPLPDSNLLLT